MVSAKKEQKLCSKCGHGLATSSSATRLLNSYISNLHQGRGKPTIACLSEDCLCTDPSC